MKTNKKMWSQATPETAKIALFGIPYDRTASYQKGTVEGPAYMRDQYDWCLEWYSPYADTELDETNICDYGDVELTNQETPEEMNAAVEKFVRPIVEKGQKIAMIGGEHSVTFPVVNVLADYYEDLHVIHFDAHTDLRDEFQGSKFSHACVIGRCVDRLGNGKVFQHGIRSGVKYEFDFHAQGKSFIEKSTVKLVPETVAKIGDKPVYITIDIDVFDPSLVSGTGTPEAGGIQFLDMINAIAQMSKLPNVVGFDLVEFSPKLDPSNTTTNVALKTFREMIISTLQKHLK